MASCRSGVLKAMSVPWLEHLTASDSTIGRFEPNARHDCCGFPEEDGWVVFPGYTAKMQEQATETRSFTDLQECKRICAVRGCGGFELQQDKATFYLCPREKLLKVRREQPLSSSLSAVPTLFLAPSSREWKEHVEWIETMEASAKLLRDLSEERCHAREAARTDGDDAQVHAIEQELTRLKRQQANLASAIWHASSEQTKGGSWHTQGDVESCCSARPAAQGASSPFSAERADKHHNTETLAESDRPTPWPATNMQSVGTKCKDQTQISKDLNLAQGKGYGKHAKGPPLPPRAGKGGPGLPTPLRRRFHWARLNAEQIRGTVFEDNSQNPASPSSSEPAINLQTVRDLFQAEDAQRDNVQRSSEASRQEVQVFDRSRAQHVAIVLRRLLGPAATIKDSESLAVALEAVEMSPDLYSALTERDADPLTLLASALPTDVEKHTLLAVSPAGSLRRVEQLALPFARVTCVASRLRALQLQEQAGDTHSTLLELISRIELACQALAASSTLRKLLRVVVQLGSWINAAAAGTECGFALSSTLGKLREFRALRGDRSVSLLHMVALSAVGGDSKEAGAIGTKLAMELDGVSDIAKLGLRQVGEAVANFRADTDWLSREAIAFQSEGHLCERFRTIHEKELQWRAVALEKAWEAVQTKMENTLTYFAERWDDKVGIEGALECLLQTVDEFCRDVQGTTQQISKWPEQYANIFPARESELWDSLSAHER